MLRHGPRCARALLIGALVVCMTSMIFTTGGVTQAATGFADPAFQQQWQQDEALAPNAWGPLAIARDGQQEPYQEASGGQRLVQYFDKGRMQLLNGTVSGGMLVTELVTGKVQLGETLFEQRPPPSIPIVGTFAGTFNFSPTYAMLASMGASLLQPATSTPGAIVRAAYETQIGDVSGRFTSDPSPFLFNGEYVVWTKGGVIDGYDESTQHNVAAAFAEYRTTMGRALIGDAISEPFATNYDLARDGFHVAIVQLFQRRVLTYTYVSPGVFRIEMTNVGQHYYQWRYGQSLVSAGTSTPCTSACVFLDRVGGPGLANVTICQSFAAYPGDPIVLTDTTGAYEARVRDTKGHQETVTVWPVAAGYTFNPPYATFITYSGGETIKKVFVATASSDAVSDGNCGSLPIFR